MLKLSEGCVLMAFWSLFCRLVVSTTEFCYSVELFFFLLLFKLSDASSLTTAKRTVVVDGEDLQGRVPGDSGFSFFLEIPLKYGRTWT